MKVKGRSAKSKALRATSSGTATADYIVMSACGDTLADMDFTRFSAVYMANECVTVTMSGTDMGLILDVDGSNFSFKLYDDADCEGDPLESDDDSMTMTTGVCELESDDDNAGSFIFSYIADSASYASPNGGFVSADMTDTCNDAPVVYFDMGYVAGSCVNDADAGTSTKLTYTADGCDMESFSGEDCAEADSGGVMEVESGICENAADNYVSTFVMAPTTVAKQAFFCAAAVEDDDEEDAICFSGSETLLLDSGVTIAMEDAKIGDRIQVSSVDGSFDFAEIIFLPHEKNFQRSAFIELETTNGSLKVSPTHLVMAGECSGSMGLTRAEDITVGACLDGTAGAEQVISSTKIFSNGVYSVITAHPDGIIVVNGFKASSFALNHAVGNSYYNIHRVLHIIAPGALKVMSGLGSILGRLAFFAASV